ncbi:hypothetical protein B296_00002805 [Ensete ventricosum]|uniref:Uncharacterized protein n=1 Tax=Ensete ventricosum TaxID=4639 RepID=A0A426YNM2_ENSVE|nr:hypothetical protein B296_00002805 [Ensete ventricosum]
MAAVTGPERPPANKPGAKPLFRRGDVLKGILRSLFLPCLRWWRLPGGGGGGENDVANAKGYRFPEPSPLRLFPSFRSFLARFEDSPAAPALPPPLCDRDPAVGSSRGTWVRRNSVAGAKGSAPRHINRSDHSQFQRKGWPCGTHDMDGAQSPMATEGNPTRILGSNGRDP